MTMQVEFYGAAGEVTGSCHLVQIGDVRILLDCGLIQGSAKDEVRNRDPFAFDPGSIDAVILSHAHIDHSARIPLLVKRGFKGTIFAQQASCDLCRVMLRDSAYLNEKETEWQNRKRERKGLSLLEPLYTQDDVEQTFALFQAVEYGNRIEVVPGVTLRFSEAGHILGSSITELWLQHHGVSRKLVYSGDLGRSGMPVLRDPAIIEEADYVIMESTYGDRLHRSWDETREEIREVFNEAVQNGRGNILIPAFAVGRTQEILFLFAKYYKEWGVDRWKIFLDSPMAIEATEAYANNSRLFDAESRQMWQQHQQRNLLPTLSLLRTAEESMQLNRVRAGAIIIAGSGMCTGGRIKHHLKHNLWRKECHIVIVGYQAEGTLGRALVDGKQRVTLWGETIRVGAKIHTVGGLSAHADQAGLSHWYAGFNKRPPLFLVHGEAQASQTLARHLETTMAAPVTIATRGMKLNLVNGNCSD
ncbi:MAG: MBL fold metallo-hydrolase [Pseudomonadota bacterium]